MILLFSLFSPIHFLAAAVLTVTHTGDTGEGSLRWALQQANAQPGADTIVFRIPITDSRYNAANGFWTIAPASMLPLITDSNLTIDGFSQLINVNSSESQHPVIFLSGFNTPTTTSGITVASSGNTIRGLSIGGFRGASIFIKGSAAHHNVVEGCYIGVLPDGVTGVFDPTHSQIGVDQSRGIYFSQDCHNNRIGGVTPEQRNIICNMFFEGILVETSHENIVQGNYIGVLKDGITPLGNGWVNIPRYDIENQKLQRFPSVRIYAGSRSNLIGGVSSGEGNVICAGGRTGVHVETEGTDSTRVLGNLIGVCADGEFHQNCGNAEAGVKVQRGARYTQIGGEGAGAGNVISGNASSGMQVREDVSNTVIAGNFIGVDAQGTRLVPNAHNGIYLFGQSDKGFPQNNVIGPGNVIIANGVEGENELYGGTWAAVRLDSLGTAHNTIFGNYLGTDAGGRLGSAYNSGVIIGAGAHDNTIGPNNVIANNHKYGVWIRQTGTIRNKITKNRIVKNGRQAVILTEGGNNMHSAPKEIVATASKVTGVGAPNSTIELFASDRHFLAAVTAGVKGYFTWNGDTGGGQVSATDTDGQANTSEYSKSPEVPVELSLFTAERVEQGVQLLWQTESERNNLGFFVERNSSAEFEEIGFVAGGGTRSDVQYYAFLDAHPLLGSAVYRLRQVDFDGAVHFSPLAEVRQNVPTDFLLSPPFPNPFNRQTAVTCSLAAETTITLEVVNCRGEISATLYSGSLPADAHRFLWDGRTNLGENAASGVYFLRMKTPDTVLVQKMVLLQ
jgi:hypothetical protein